SHRAACCRRGSGRRESMSEFAPAGDPVIPDYGQASDCVINNGAFCTDWFISQWSTVFWPPLLSHIVMVAIAVSIGFVIAFFAAPVIPDYVQAFYCVINNGAFCTDWFISQWSTVFGPPLLSHIVMVAIAVSIGFVIAFFAALLAYRKKWLAGPIGMTATFLYT